MTCKELVHFGSCEQAIKWLNAMRPEGDQTNCQSASLGFARVRAPMWAA